MTAVSGVTYYTLKNHTAGLRGAKVASTNEVY